MLAILAAFSLGTLRTEDPILVIDNVNVVDVAAAKELPNRTVLIDHGRILLIADKPELVIGPSIQHVDGTGKFLIPGLWDMHVHGTAAPGFLGLYLANGVTGVRDMFDPTPRSIKLRDDVNAGKTLGPHFYAAGRLLDGPKPIWTGSIAVADADQGRKAVDQVLREGSNFVKVYSLLPREAYFAIADECKKRHVVFAGHVPESVTAFEASDAGQKCFEHLYGVPRACCDPKNPVPHDQLIDLPRAERNEVIRHVLANYNEDQAQKLFRLLKKNGSWQCPTITVLYSLSHRNDDRADIAWRFDYLPTWLKAQWEAVQNRAKKWSKEDEELEDRLFQSDLALVGRLAKAGVPILAGTDVMNPYCMPGFSLHDELVWLVKAGLSSGEALKAATLGPAVYLGIQKDYGTVQKGKVADLVLLDADPLADIHNTTKIRAVVLGGKLLDRETLDKLMPKHPGASSMRPPEAVLGAMADDETPF